MTYFIYAYAQDSKDPPDSESFIPNYTTELALADDPTKLVEHLDLLLVGGELSDNAKSDIASVVEGYPLERESDPDYDGAAVRVATAVLMVMTSPDYIVQQ